MKNRKAKILLARRNDVGVWRWLRISNRRVRLTGCCGVMGHQLLQKAQRGAKPLEKPLAQ